MYNIIFLKYYQLTILEINVIGRKFVVRLSLFIILSKNLLLTLFVGI